MVATHQKTQQGLKLCMNLDYDEETGAVSAQFPDIWISLYPSGIKHLPLGKKEHYRGALLIRKGDEHIHLNALDIGDLLLFLDHGFVKKVRQRMTDEYVKENLLRSMILRANLLGEDDAVGDV